MSLDLYLAYLRAAFHTCYYCSVTTDHVEELQRKCIKHVRKAPIEASAAPPTTTTTSESTAEAVKEEAKEDVKEENVEKPFEKKDTKSGNENKKEGRNGRLGSRAWRWSGKADFRELDDRWLEWLDSKIALLINREGVDPRDYGGKSYEEYVFLSTRHQAF